MRTKSILYTRVTRAQFERTLPRGSGVLIVGALSLVLWGMIVGFALSI